MFFLVSFIDWSTAWHVSLIWHGVYVAPHLFVYLCVCVLFIYFFYLLSYTAVTMFCVVCVVFVLFVCLFFVFESVSKFPIAFSNFFKQL